MKSIFKNKFFIILSSVVSLFSVAVGAIATAAWFQIDTQSPEFTNTTATPNLTIDNENITGYKINPTLGTDGFPDYSSSTVAHKKGATYETDNHNQDDADTVFDVPSQGLGYYLLKKNPSDTYKYNYSGGGTYAWKFKELNNNGINYATIDSSTLGTISSSDTFIIRKYSYDSANYKTVNVKLDISKDNSDDTNFSINSDTYEITPSSGSAVSFNIWLNKDTKKVAFEEPFNISDKNVARSQGSKAKANTVPSRASYSITVYYAISTSYTVKANPNTGAGWIGDVTMTKQTYSYKDMPVYSATITSSNATFYEIQFQLYDGSTWKSQQLGLNNTGTNYSSLNNKIWWSGSGTTRNSFFDNNFMLYDGWLLIGKSGSGSTTFGDPSTYDFVVSQSHRLNAPDDSSRNQGQLQIDLNVGDNFKICYLKGGSTEQWYGFDKLQVWNGTDNHSSIGTYFESNDGNCQVKIAIKCTIYFTNETYWDHLDTTSKWINVNITSSLIVKASKFDFEGNYEGIADTNAGTLSVSLGSEVLLSTINALSLNIPANYSRVGTSVYSNSACTADLGSSFTASTNPLTIYIKVKENPITIYLVPYFSDTSSGSDGASDNSRKMTLDTQFGANSSISQSDLKDLWDETYADTLTYNSANYTYSRIETSEHSSSISTGTIADGTTLYVRYVRVTHTITLAPSYFAPGGTTRLSFSIQSNKTESLLDYNDFTTSKTFDNCEYKDHTNGIWYVFARADNNWYTSPACTTTFSNKIRANTTLYAKMVAYPVTVFYIDADYPGWDNCYLHMWGTLSGVDSAMDASLTAKAITTSSGNKLYRIAIPTEGLTGFLLHAGNNGNQTVNITAASLTGSDSKYCRIAGDTANARTATFTEYKTTSATNVWVQKYSNSTWTNVENGQLLHGDGVGNSYILESGLQLTNGDIIRVYDANTKTAYGYSQYIEGNKSKHKYVATAHSGAAITISRLGAANETARFNFYITTGGGLSIAMVPDYGNGYYIMEYNSTDGVENYIGATKMDSSEYSASYDGWYCGDISTKIFIRSYLNAVDNICNSLTSASLAYVDALDANNCITFKATGHYNIRVTNQIIDISPYDIDDFFSLNRLDSSLLTSENDDDKQQEIWRQKTAIVMEIPFTANNPYAASIQLKTECSASWIGVRFAVYSSQLATPYETLHGADNSLYTSSYLTAANTSSFIADTNELTISANSGATYYAYVLIDYRYTVTAENLTSATPEVGLYLQVVQN